MIVCKSIKKIKSSSGKITRYIVLDKNGITKEFASAELNQF